MANMRYLIFFVSFVSPIFLSAQSKFDQKVLAAEQKRFDAMTKADTAALHDMLASDLWYVHSNGMFESKNAHLAAIAERNLVYQRMEREEAVVRRFGRKAALVNGTVKVLGIIKGSPFEVRLYYSALYRKKGGKWQLANWQSTRR
jgi:hypothetical protein